MAEADGKIESFIDSLKTFAPLDLGLVKLKENGRSRVVHACAKVPARDRKTCSRLPRLVLHLTDSKMQAGPTLDIQYLRTSISINIPSVKFRNRCLKTNIGTAVHLIAN